MEEAGGAIFSKCRTYRYVLWRKWDPDRPAIMFIGLNPSLADATTDDPTIRRMTQFAKDWGFGTIYVVNLFAYVTPYPTELHTCKDPVGSRNNHHIKHYAALSSEVVFCWGTFDARGRADAMKRLFPRAKCIQKNRNGSPRHPLYISGKEQLKVFEY